MASVWRWLCLLLWMSLLTACGGGSDSTDQDVQVIRGHLALSITGLPAGAQPALTLVLPSASSVDVSAYQSLNNLEPGTYSLNAAAVTVAGKLYSPTPNTQNFSIVAGQTTTVAVAYKEDGLQVGTLSVNIVGLPQGTAAKVKVTSSNGYEQNLSQSQNLEGLAAGSYTVTANDVQVGDDTYTASPSSQLLALNVGKTINANVNYSLAGVQVVVSPNPVTVRVGGTQQFSAKVSGNVNQAVVWGVTPGGGSISGTGLYTASSQPGTYTIRATSVADGRRYGEVQVVVASQLSVAVYPASLSLPLGDAVAMSAEVSAAQSNRNVTWSLQESLSLADLLVGDWREVFLPKAEGVFHVQASSVEDSSKTAVATYTVTPAPGPVATASFASLKEQRDQAQAVRLTGDTVLVFGGLSNSKGVLKSAEVFGSGQWNVLGASMSEGKINFTATVLGDQTVLIVGGSDGTRASKASELYIPGLVRFAATSGQLNVPRLHHQALRLNDGRVLVLGGAPDQMWNDAQAYASAEMFDNKTGFYSSLLNSMNEGRAQFTATLLGNGQVLIVGGWQSSSRRTLASAELYDPSTGKFRLISGGGLSHGRYAHSATLLADGRVLIAGGNTETDSGSTSMEIYDPATERFTEVATPLKYGRAYHSATLLSNGQVLLAGGQTYWTTRGSMELFDPVKGTVQATRIALPRANHAAVRLSNGQVLLVGGSNGQTLSAVELY